jgi:hypothetical protein
MRLHRGPFTGLVSHAVRAKSPYSYILATQSTSPYNAPLSPDRTYHPNSTLPHPSTLLQSQWLSTPIIVDFIHWWTVS